MCTYAHKHILQLALCGGEFYAVFCVCVRACMRACVRVCICVCVCHMCVVCDLHICVAVSAAMHVCAIHDGLLVLAIT